MRKVVLNQQQPRNTITHQPRIPGLSGVSLHNLLQVRQQYSSDRGGRCATQNSYVATERQQEQSEEDSNQLLSARGDEAIDQDDSLARLSDEEPSSEYNIGDELDIVSLSDVELQLTRRSKNNDRQSNSLDDRPLLAGMRSQISFAADSRTSSHDTRKTANFAFGPTLDKRRFQNMGSAGFHKAVTRWQANISGLNLKREDTTSLLSQLTSQQTSQVTQVTSIDQFLKILADNKYPIQLDDGESTYELAPTVINSITQKFGVSNVNMLVTIPVDKSIDNFYESDNASLTNNNHNRLGEASNNSAETSSNGQQEEVKTNTMAREVMGQAASAKLMEEEEDDEYAAMMAELALDIDTNEVPPIAKQEQNVAQVLIRELRAAQLSVASPRPNQEVDVPKSETDSGQICSKIKEEQEEASEEEEDDEYAELMRMMAQDIEDESATVVCPPPAPIENVAAMLVNLSPKICEESQQLEEDDEYAEIMRQMEEDLSKQVSSTVSPLPPKRIENPAAVLMDIKVMPGLPKVDQLNNNSFRGPSGTITVELHNNNEKRSVDGSEGKRKLRNLKKLQSSERNLFPTSMANTLESPEFSRCNSVPQDQDEKDLKSIAAMSIKESSDIETSDDDDFQRFDSNYLSHASQPRERLDSRANASEYDDARSTSVFDIYQNNNHSSRQSSNNKKKVSFQLGLVDQTSFSTDMPLPSQTTTEKLKPNIGQILPQDSIDEYAKFFGIDPAILHPEINASTSSAALIRLALAINSNSKTVKQKGDKSQMRRKGMLINDSSVDPTINAILQPARKALIALRQVQTTGGAASISSSTKDPDGNQSSPNEYKALLCINAGPTPYNSKHDSLRNSAKISVLSLAFKHYMAQQEQNEIKRYKELQSMMHKSKEMSDMLHVFKKRLHFAFLFASPLVLLKSADNFKYFPQLDHNKEFNKIRNAISNALVQVQITKRQCTSDILQEILAQQPIGLHFSGHGILNNEDLGREFYERNKDQGDFLVLENSSGSSELVSREAIKKMIDKNKCELEFVFVATCHSEFVGRIFQQAGAKHVICIQQSEEVLDAAVIDFTDMFYKMLFEQNKHICKAFEQAKLSVEISFSAKEASIFVLLLQEDLDSSMMIQKESSFNKQSCSSFNTRAKAYNSKKKHQCKVFGPFRPGLCTLVEPRKQHVKTKEPHMPNLRGRQTETFRIIDKILNSKVSRLFTLVGWPGVGKSALVTSMLNYISERNLVLGGSIYINARNESVCDHFIRTFNKILIENNPNLFGNLSEQVLKKPIDILVSILNKLSIIESEMLLVIDNAENIITSDRAEFQMLLSMMLTMVAQLRILLTSQRPLQQTCDYKEQIIELEKLSDIQSANLFKEVCGKEIQQWEINKLLQTRPDPSSYPNEQAKMYRSFKDHHLFTLLNGNPQSIIMVASQLAEPQKNLKIHQIYQMLTENNFVELLQGEDAMQISLKLSAQLSFKTIEEDDPESTQLLYLLGLLPGGISPQKLDYLWSKINEQNNTLQTMIKHRSFVDMQKIDEEPAAYIRKPTVVANWRRAFSVLERSKLAAKSQRHDNFEGKIKKEVILSPEIVRGFSSGSRDEDISKFFLQILGEWYLQGLHNIYKSYNNVVYHQTSAYQRQLSTPTEDDNFECFTENIGEFIHLIREKYQNNLMWRQSMQLDRKEMDELQEDDLQSDSSSEEEELQGYAEAMFGDKSCASTVQFHPNSFVNTDGETNPLRSSQTTRVRLHSAKKQRTQSTAVVKREPSPQPIFDQINDISPDLLDAYNRIQEKKPVLQQFVKASRLKVHPHHFTDRVERAQKYWRWAFDQIINKKDDEWKMSPNIICVVGKLEEEYCPDENVKSPSQARLSDVITVFPKVVEEEEHKMRRETFILPRKARQDRGMTTFHRRVTHMMSRQVPVIQQQAKGMNTDEQCMLYFLMNQILRKQYKMADTLIKKQILGMKKCSALFKGNLRRIQALSSSEQVLERIPGTSSTLMSHDSSNSQIDDQQFVHILETLTQSLEYFEKDNCSWGIGLINFHQAYILKHRIEAIGMREPAQILTWLREAQSKFKKAVKAFQQINHLRGCLRSYSLLIQLKQMTDDAKLNNAPSGSNLCIGKKKRDYFQLLGSIDIFQNEDYEKKSSEFAHQCERYMQRMSKSNSDLVIVRKEGEDYSLLTEIVTECSNKVLFVDDNNY